MNPLNNLPPLQAYNLINELLKDHPPYKMKDHIIHLSSYNTNSEWYRKISDEAVQITNNFLRISVDCCFYNNLDNTIKMSNNAIIILQKMNGHLHNIIKMKTYNNCSESDVDYFFNNFKKIAENVLLCYNNIEKCQIEKIDE